MFHTLLQEAGLPRLRFHDLRHSAATILLAMGVNVKVVQELLGPSYVTMTLNIYGHVLPGQQQAAIEKMSDLFAQEGVNRELMRNMRLKGYLRFVAICGKNERDALETWSGNKSVIEIV